MLISGTCSLFQRVSNSFKEMVALKVVEVVAVQALVAPHAGVSWHHVWCQHMCHPHSVLLGKGTPMVRVKEMVPADSMKSATPIQMCK